MGRCEFLLWRCFFLLLFAARARKSVGEMPKLRRSLITTTSRTYPTRGVTDRQGDRGDRDQVFAVAVILCRAGPDRRSPFVPSYCY